MDLDSFNAASAEELTPALLACCDVPAWATAILAGCPYRDVESLLETADAAARELSAEDVEKALAAHPRIGERAEGTSTEAGWSRNEQSGVDGEESTRAALLEGNRAYEKRFGRVFLICASGLSGARILSELRRRLTNDEDTETAVVADELRKIALLRLRGLVEQEDAG